MGLFDPILDAVVPYLPADKFPTSAKTLLKTLQGDKSDITHANFTPEELAMLRRLIEVSGGRGYVTYGDYINLGKQLKQEGTMPLSVMPSLLSMGDPLGNLQTTLGRFRYSRNPDGSLHVTDTYDFNPTDKTSQAEAGAGAAGPYGVIRAYAGNRIPPGKGRNVAIDLRDTTWEPPVFPDTVR